MNPTEKISAFLAHIKPSLSQSSMTRFQFSLSHFTRFFPQEPETITSGDISRWIDHQLQSGSHARTVKFNVSLARRYFVWLDDNGLVPANHSRVIAVRRLPKLVVPKTIRNLITEEEHRRVLVQAGKKRRKPGLGTACQLGWHSGLRLSDVCALRWDSIDWERGVIKLVPIKTRKFGVEVRVPMTEDLTEHLRLVKAEWTRYPSDYVLPFLAGYYANANGDEAGLSGFFSVLFHRCGFNATFHCYRHTFVSRLVNAGISPLVIASMTGQTLQTIAGYTQVSDEAQRNAIEQARQGVHQARLRERGFIPPVHQEIIA